MAPKAKKKKRRGGGGGGGSDNGPCPLRALLRDGCAAAAPEELHGELIFTRRDVLSAAESRAMVEWAEARGFELAKQRGGRGYAHRENGRIALDSEPFAQALWERLRDAVPPRVGALEACGLNRNIRLYRYTPGQRFGKHVDESVDTPGGGETHYTVLVYLNDGYGGGHTVFYDDDDRTVLVSVRPRAGMALLHGHGQRCATHEGAEVTRGTKYLLRTDVVYRPPRRRK